MFWRRRVFLTAVERACRLAVIAAAPDECAELAAPDAGQEAFGALTVAGPDRVFRVGA